MPALLLTASLQPLNVISRRRLVILLTKERVAFLDQDAERALRLQLQERRVGEGMVVVRLLRTITIPRRVLRPNRRNLLLRDDCSCQYCGVRAAPAELTIDHVLPVSRGGASNSWENQVVACRRCNGRKADRLPVEANLRLRRPPRPVVREYAQLLFLRYPEAAAAYERLLRSALPEAGQPRRGGSAQPLSPRSGGGAEGAWGAAWRQPAQRR